MMTGAARQVRMKGETPAPVHGAGREARTQRRSAGEALALDQTDVSRTRALLRLLWGELDALPLAKQLEHRTANRATVEKVLDAVLIPDEPEPLVD
jgi:hypothetical protein